MLRNGLTLTIYALIVTGLIALTHLATKDTIAQQERIKLLSILHAIVDEQSYSNEMHTDCAVISNPDLLGDNKAHRVYRARNGNKPVAAAIETIAPDGYNGKIKIVVGITVEGTVTGVRVLEHKETPGLGDKIDLRISDWILSFNGLFLNDENQSRWAVKKDGGQFDQFTGATITPRAVVKATKQAVTFFQQNQTRIFQQQNACSGNVLKSIDNE